MTWLLTWLNESVATLKTTLQLLVLYRFLLKKKKKKKNILSLSKRIKKKKKKISI